jgi:ABC-type lipoprotein export system ATPase subunit
MKHIFRSTSQIEQGQSIAKLSDVNKGFNGEPIISDVNLQINKGDFVVVTGPSGSGKSTLLRTMAGLERPDSGTVDIFGNDLYKMKENRRSQLISKRLGVGFQSHNLDTGLSLLDNIESLAETGGRVDYQRVGKLVIGLGLQEKAMRRESVANLSGGEKQRLSLGRLLVPKPELVLLDEPTAAIDPHGKHSIYELLQDLNQTEGTTFVIISHDSVAKDYATREIVVDSGQVVADQPIAPRPFTPAA